MGRAVAKLVIILLGLVHARPALAAEAPTTVESLWPFFYVRRGGGETELEVLGPLGFYQDSPEAKTFGLRPLFSRHHEKAAKRSTLHILYPLTYFRTEPGASRYYAFPLFYRHWRMTPNGSPTIMNMVFPLFYWGRSPTGGPWWFVLFLGGHARNFLGWDEVLYGGMTYIKERKGDYTAHHVLWPFFTIGRGGGKRVLRLWPFYGYAEQEGKWWNGYVLWPFFTYGQREATEWKMAARFFSFWPLFGFSRALDGSGASYQVLWPLFFYAWGTHKGYREWDLPFPILRGKRTDDVQTFNVWPLYGQRRYAAGLDRYVLWPLVHASRFRGSHRRSDDLKVFPLLTRSSWADTAAAARGSFTLLWPLWRSRSRQVKDQEQGEANSLQFAFVANAEGFDRNYNALLGLVEHERRRDGQRATRLLWRFFRSERGPGWSYLQLGPLASWQRSGSLTRSSYLLGLVQTGVNNGRRGWRILYVPFGASLSRPARPPAKEHRRGEQ